MAHRVVNELVDVAEAAFGGRRGPRNLDDELLFALLSHQPLAGRQSTVSFAKELFGNLPDAEQRHALEALELLIVNYRCRRGSDRYIKYEPTALDRIRQLAAYSANLILLRVALEPDNVGVPLSVLLRKRDTASQEWRATINLWRSGLDADGLHAMLSSLIYVSGSVELAINSETPTLLPGISDLWFSQLVDDALLEERLRYGIAIKDSYIYHTSSGKDWREAMSSWLIPRIAGMDTPTVLIPPPPGVSDEAVEFIANLSMRLLKWHRNEKAFEEDLVLFLLRLPRVFTLDTQALAAAVVRNPKLIDKVPELSDPKVFGRDLEVLRLFVRVDKLWGLEAIVSEEDIMSLPKGLDKIISRLSRAYSP